MADTADDIIAPADAMQVVDLVHGTDDITVIENAHQDQRHCDKVHSPRESAVLSPPRRSTLGTLLEPRPSVAEFVVAEVTTFHDVFGYLGVPMIIVFALSAIWTFTLAYIQVHATEMANSVMNTTNFDNGEFWLLPHPENYIVVTSAVMLSLFGIGYASLIVIMLLFGRFSREDKTITSIMKSSGDISSTADTRVVESTKDSMYHYIVMWLSRKWCSVPKDIRDHYYVS